MRFQTFVYAAACACALSACTEPQPQERSTAQPSEAPASVHSRGVVVAVTREYDAITIRHEPIPEYGMGEMTMEFTVADGAQLEGIEVGDHVSFELSGPIDIKTITVSPDN